MKKIFCVLMAVCLLIQNPMCLVYGNEKNGGTVSPKFIAIMQVALNLEKLSSNKVRCWAENIVEYGKIAKVKVELQKKDGIWGTIKTWEDTCDSYAFVEKEWYIESNYKHRMKVTFEAYTEDMVFIERSIQYSEEI